LRLNRTLEVFEELAVGRQHQHIAFLAERALVSLQAAIERIEVRLRRVRLGVDVGRLLVRRAAYAERRLFGRRIAGVGEGFGGSPTLAEDILSSLEARALWGRYGL